MGNQTGIAGLVDKVFGKLDNKDFGEIMRIGSYSESPQEYRRMVEEMPGRISVITEFNKTWVPEFACHATQRGMSGEQAWDYFVKASEEMINKGKGPEDEGESFHDVPFDVIVRVKNDFRHITFESYRLRDEKKYNFKAYFTNQPFIMERISKALRRIRVH